LLPRIANSGIQAVAFPDEGSSKRFGKLFDRGNYSKIVCGKVRDGDKRIVTVQDGDPEGRMFVSFLSYVPYFKVLGVSSTGKEVIVVDDLVQTGGTLYECALALKAKGATRVSAFVTHAVFPNNCWADFCVKTNGRRAVFHKFYVTNSIPTVTLNLPEDDVFEIVDLLPQIITDLDLGCVDRR
jgi:phosphoribosylpyrophosphate synthetase